MFQERICDSTTSVEILISISNLSVVTNSSINFVVYIWRGSEFRKVFKQRFKCNNSKKAHKDPLCTLGLTRYSYYYDYKNTDRKKFEIQKISSSNNSSSFSFFSSKAKKYTSTSKESSNDELVQKEINRVSSMLTVTEETEL